MRLPLPFPQYEKNEKGCEDEKAEDREDDRDEVGDPRGGARRPGHHALQYKCN